MSQSRLPRLYLVAVLFGIFAPVTGARAADFLTIEPANVSVCAGGSATFTPKKGSGIPLVTWNLASPNGSLEPGTATNTVKYTALDPEDVEDLAPVSGTIWLSATSPDGAEVAWASITLNTLCRRALGGEAVRATLGFEQVGAAGTASDQKFSFDFFISRPLPFGGHGSDKITNDEYYFGSRLRWWGDVRIGSYPQQINSDLATFSQSFGTNLGKVSVNKLVQSAEFLTGPEIRLAGFSTTRNSATEPGGARFALMGYFGIGSIGPFPPGDDPSVFAAPAAPAAGAAASAQYTAFHTLYPAISSKYVSFVPPDHTQFSKQWSAGVRLYTFYSDTTPAAHPLAKPPASVEIGFGRNYFVAPDGAATWRASAYYPFALGDRTKPDTLILYFFGDVNMRLDPTTDTSRTLFLAPAVDSAGTAVPITNADVALVPAPATHRDTYRIGVSVDLLRIWNKLSAPAAPATPAAK